MEPLSKNTSETTDSTIPATRRQVLAFLALADAPMPSWIRFQSDGVLCLDVDTLAAGTAWRDAFGDCGWWGNEPHLMNETPGHEPYFSANWYGDWRGWHIRLHATEPAPSIGAELDADTRNQLAAAQSSHRATAGGGR